MPKYLDDNGLLYFWQKIKAKFVSDVTYESSTGKLKKTKNGAASDVVTIPIKTTTTPKANGTASVGSETKYAAGDHVHPLQTTVSGNAGTATTLQNARAIDGVNFDGSSAIKHFGQCSDAGLAKTVGCPGFVLEEGARISVLFTAAPAPASESQPYTLNVNNTGAKNIVRTASQNSLIEPERRIYQCLDKGLVYEFVYTDGKYALISSPYINTSYSDATTTAHGLMSAADKTKLNELAYITEAGETLVSGAPPQFDVTVKSGSTSHTTALLTVGARGAAYGVASLDKNGMVLASQLPSYVDDVIEAYARSGQTALSSTWLATGSATGTVITPEKGKIYVLMGDSGDYAANTQFRWSGTAYVKLADGGVSAITNAEIDTILAA